MLRLMQQLRVVGDGEHHARQGGSWDFFSRYDHTCCLRLHFSHGNQQTLNLSRVDPSLCRMTAKEDWAIEIVVAYAQKDHTQGQNRRAAREWRRGKSRAHIR
jgi:hypothetical protein